MCQILTFLPFILQLWAKIDNLLKLVPLEPCRFSAIFEKNPDPKAMKKIGSVLKGESKEMDGMAPSLLYKFWNT